MPQSAPKLLMCPCLHSCLSARHRPEHGHGPREPKSTAAAHHALRHVVVTPRDDDGREAGNYGVPCLLAASLCRCVGDDSRTSLLPVFCRHSSAEIRKHFNPTGHGSPHNTLHQRHSHSSSTGGSFCFTVVRHAMPGQDRTEPHTHTHTHTPHTSHHTQI